MIEKSKDILTKSLHPIYDGLRPLNLIEGDISKSTSHIKDLEEQQDKNHDLKERVSFTIN